MPVVVSGSGSPKWILNASSACGPISASGPLWCGVADGQVHSCGGVLVGEVPLGLDRLAQLPVQRLDRVGGGPYRGPPRKARNGITYSQASSQALVMTGNRAPHFSSKASSSACAWSVSLAGSFWDGLGPYFPPCLRDSALFLRFGVAAKSFARFRPMAVMFAAMPDAAGQAHVARNETKGGGKVYMSIAPTGRAARFANENLGSLSSTC